MNDIRKGYEYAPLPARLTIGDIDEILRHLETCGGFSDLYVASDSQMKVKALGDIIPVTQRHLSISEVEDIINEMFAHNATTELGIAKPIDFSYEVAIKPGSRSKKYRYRVNATAIRPRMGTSGISITMRSISSEPWHIDEMDVEEEVVKNFNQDQGLILVTGSTGSGKSTLMSAAIRKMLETKGNPRLVLTYEAPIEYVYDNVDMGDNIIYQSEVPTHVRTFSTGVVAALRRNPDVILVGEARDKETISAAAEASMTGHLVISTVHANTVAETLRRLVVQFDKEEQMARLIDLTSAMRMIVTQRLEKTLDGGRVALREYLIFTPEIREEIYRGGIEQVTPVVRSLVDKHGQSMLACAQRYYDQGIVNKQVLTRAEMA